MAFAMIFGLLSAHSEAQDTPKAPLSEQQSQALDARLASIAAGRADIKRLVQLVAQTSDIPQRILTRRIENRLLALFDAINRFADDVADLGDRGVDASRYRVEASRLLQDVLAVLHEAVDRTDQELASSGAAGRSGKAIERAEYDARITHVATRLLALYKAAWNTIAVQRRYGLDTSVETTWLQGKLGESVEEASVFLEITDDDLHSLRLRRGQLPADAETEASMRVTEGRLRQIAEWYSAALDLMERTGLDVTQARQGLIAETGEVTTDILNVGVAAGLVGRAAAYARTWLIHSGPGALFKTILIAAILVGAWLAARVVKAILGRALDERHLHMSTLLRRVVIGTVSRLIVIIGILLCLSQIGLSIGPMLAGLGVISIIVGFALQNTLSNFTSGLLLLLYRPFDVGDEVQAAGVTGTVRYMTLANTTLFTADNQKVIVPNNSVWGSPIRNISDSAGPPHGPSGKY